MLKHLLTSAVVILPAAFIVGCSSSGSSSASDAPAATQPAEIPIPADSPLAKIKVGMSGEEVVSILGNPTSQGAYATGKSFIPFHYGGDNYRRIYRYKGMGNIIMSQNSSFTSGVSVIEVHYDPNETGF